MKTIIALIAIAAAVLAGAIQLQAQLDGTPGGEIPAQCLSERVLLGGGNQGPDCGPARLDDGF